jgi:hypothetical protein
MSFPPGPNQSAASRPATLPARSQGCPGASDSKKSYVGVVRVTMNDQAYSDEEWVYVGGFLPFTQDGPNKATVSVTQDVLRAHVAWWPSSGRIGR